MATSHWRPYAVWAAVIIPVWLVLVLGTYWEPVVRDSWGHVWWHDKTDVTLLRFAKETYLYNNPRAGQVIAWLLFSPGPWHVIITPLVELALFLLLATLVLGRWPSLRRIDDALVVATLVAMIVATCPLVGPMLFYRPYSGNYLYGLVLNLALVVPYRLALASPSGAWARPRHWLAPLLLVTGLLAGLSNEHTDPALVAVTALATGLAWRRGQLRPWMLAGLVGAVAGAALLYFAPGQNLRYEGLATQQSLVERITARGADNLDIITLLGRYLRPLVWWGLLAAVCAMLSRAAPRRIPRVTWLLAATGLAITLTLLASPKQGGRLYLASVALSCAAATALLMSQLQVVRSHVPAIAMRALAWALVAVFAIRAGANLVSVYAAVGPEGQDRLAKIRSAPPGSTLTVAPYSRPRSRWFMGDDFVHEKWRAVAADGWGLSRIDLAGSDTGAAEPADDD